MLSKRRWLIALACTNALFVALLCGAPLLPARAFAAEEPPPPVAPPAALSGRYLAVAGEMQDQYDAVYLLDTKNRAIHVFVFDRSMRRLNYVAARDLDTDFRNK